jgi:hypothetical protein
MRRFDSSSVIRQRMHRLKKRKTVLRRQQSLREQMLLVKPEDQLVDTHEPPAGIESTIKQDQ